MKESTAVLVQSHSPYQAPQKIFGSVKRIERVSLRYETLKSTFIEDIIQTFFGNHNLQFPEKRFCMASGRHLLDANRLANSSGYGARLTDFQHLAIIVRYYLDFLFPNV